MIVSTVIGPVGVDENMFENFPCEKGSVLPRGVAGMWEREPKCNQGLKGFFCVQEAP